MAKLIYAAITSLDGYVADEQGSFDWAVPDDAVHAAVNDVERPIGTYLYGRRLYQVMTVWDEPGMLADERSVERDFAELWQAADKVVYSTSLANVSTAKTRIERQFDAGAVAEMKRTADRDITIGGPTLAAHAIAAGLVDEYHQFVNPIVVGGGTPWLPGRVRVSLELVDEHRFDGGVVHLHYRART